MALPRFSHVLELCLCTYSIPAALVTAHSSSTDAKSLPTSLKFYSETLALGPPFLSTPRVAAFSMGNTTLLVFQRGSTLADSDYKYGPHPAIIPGHGLSDSADDQKIVLKTHFALAVEARKDVDRWEEELESKGVKLLGAGVDWPKGGRSIYFEVSTHSFRAVEVGLILDSRIPMRTSARLRVRGSGLIIRYVQPYKAQKAD